MNPQSAKDDIGCVVDILARSRSLLFITGAGISADSGLPTYRGIGGLYNAEHPEEGIPIEEVLSGEMLRRRPELTWKYLGQIEQATRGAQPNRAHQVIAEMESCFERVWTLTQNIDGLHRQAGAKNVLEIHGSLHNLICTGCQWQQTVVDYSGLSLPPRCPRCQAILRPKVVLFERCCRKKPSSRSTSNWKRVSMPSSASARQVSFPTLPAPSKWPVVTAGPPSRSTLPPRGSPDLSM